MEVDVYEKSEISCFDYHLQYHFVVIADCNKKGPLRRTLCINSITYAPRGVNATLLGFLYLFTY